MRGPVGNVRAYTASSNRIQEPGEGDQDHAGPSDVARERHRPCSITFYKQALAPLGYIVKAHHEPTLGFGVDDGTLHSDFYVSPIEGLEAEASPVTPVTHIAFLADSQQAVQAFHAAALAAGGRDNGAPGPRPYHPGYYSAFVLDPDGNNIEAVVDWAHSNE